MEPTHDESHPQQRGKAETHQAEHRPNTNPVPSVSGHPRQERDSKDSAAVEEHEQVVAAAMRDYRAGLPARDAATADLYAEWAHLDAEDHAAAYEERQRPEEAYERYDGPLSWSDWKREYDDARIHQLDDEPDLSL